MATRAARRNQAKRDKIKFPWPGIEAKYCPAKMAKARARHVHPRHKRGMSDELPGGRR